MVFRQSFENRSKKAVDYLLKVVHQCLRVVLIQLFFLCSARKDNRYFQLEFSAKDDAVNKDSIFHVWWW